MRTAFLITALAAVAIAFPHPQETDESLPEDPDEEQPGATLTTLLPTLTALPIPSTSLNIPITTTPSTPDDEDEGNSDSDDDTQSTTSRRRPHREPLPVFSKKCHCELATARYPCWATDALQRCNFEEVFSYGCYMQAFGGCPTPTRVCSKLFAPTPRPGRHPCEFDTGDPKLTTPVITGVPWTTGNVTVSNVPVLSSPIVIPGLPLPSVNVTFTVLPTTVATSVL